MATSRIPTGTTKKAKTLSFEDHRKTLSNKQVSLPERQEAFGKAIEVASSPREMLMLCLYCSEVIRGRPDLQREFSSKIEDMYEKQALSWDNIREILSRVKRDSPLGIRIINGLSTGSSPSFLLVE